MFLERAKMDEYIKDFLSKLIAARMEGGEDLECATAFVAKKTGMALWQLNAEAGLLDSSEDEEEEVENEPIYTSEHMNTTELLEMIQGYISNRTLDPSAGIIVEVWHDDETAEHYPLTMASGSIETQRLTLYARGDDPERN